MKYILMMQFAFDAWKEGNISTWAPQDVTANREFLMRFQKDLTETGEFVESEGLGGPELMKRVQARADSTYAVTDGPFPEAKEFLAGFWIVDVESADRAHEIAARLSSLPGRGGKPANIPIIVRPVMTDRREDW